MKYYLKWLQIAENFFIGLFFILKWRFGYIKDTYYLSAFRENRRLTFSDDFNRDYLDITKWNYPYGWGKTDTRVSSYSKSEENIMIHNGKIKLNVKKESGISNDWYEPVPYTYTHSSIDTNNKFFQTYGRWEASIKVANNKRLWPAFWLLTKTWQDDRRKGYNGNKDNIMPEIDIFEHFGGENNKYKDMIFTYHCGASYDKSEHIFFPTHIKHLNFSRGFLVYSIEWTEDYIKWYVNDSLVKVFRFKYLSDKRDIANKPCYIILDDIVNWENGDKYEKKYTLPDGMEVDWVRVYQ